MVSRSSHIEENRRHSAKDIRCLHCFQCNHFSTQKRKTMSCGNLSHVALFFVKPECTPVIMWIVLKKLNNPFFLFPTLPGNGGQPTKVWEVKTIISGVMLSNLPITSQLFVNFQTKNDWGRTWPPEQVVSVPCFPTLCAACSVSTLKIKSYICARNYL